MVEQDADFIPVTIAEYPAASGRLRLSSVLRWKLKALNPGLCMYCSLGLSDRDWAISTEDRETVHEDCFIASRTMGEKG